MVELERPIFIVHGLGGHPTENWFGWLNQELTKLNYSVTVPQFPHADQPQLTEWQVALQPYESILQQDPILIGHSLGVPFILTMLEHYSAAAAFLVAGFGHGPVGNKFDDRLAPFTQHHFDWNKIRQHCQKFSVIHSDNDPYVPLAKANDLAQQLDTAVNLIPNAGHFNTKSGYDTFPWLLERIQKL